MSRNSLTLALAATVSLGAFALSASTASAFHPAGAGAVGGVKLYGGAGPHVYNKPIVTGIKIMPPKVTGIVIKPPPVTGIIIKPPHPIGVVINHPHPHWWWGRPYWVAPAVATGAVATGGVASYAATTPSTPTTNRCTCLTKEYTPQGAVVFKDVCTNETAMNPPVDASPTADMAPQMTQQPIQQGYLQPQAR
jgi:hypothetical protein